MKFVSTRQDFTRKHNAFMDILTGHMALDMEVILKTSAGMPVDTGAMKADTRHFKSEKTGKYRVEVDKAYAAFQERGQREDGSHEVRQYTTPGTSAGFFQRAIDIVTENRQSYVNEARSAVGL